MFALVAPLIAGLLAGHSVVQIIIYVIVIIAAIAIFIAFINYSGVTVPPLIRTVFFILAGAAICIIGLRLLLEL